MTIFRFVFKRTLKKPLDFVMLLLLPILCVFISAETWLPVPLGFQLYGLVIMFISSKICKTMMEDREKKVVLRLAASPITHLRYLIENLFAYTLILTVINAIVVSLGVLIYGAALSSPFKLFILYSAFSATSIGVSIAWYALFRHSETAYSILGGLYVSIAMLGGMFWPYEIMPISIQKAIQILPTFWFAEGMRIVTTDGNEGRFIINLGILVLYGVACVLLGSRKRIA